MASPSSAFLDGLWVPVVGPNLLSYCGKQRRDHWLLLLTASGVQKRNRVFPMVAENSNEIEAQSSCLSIPSLTASHSRELCSSPMSLLRLLPP